MKISSQTKIATLLKGHPDALETIVTLSPDFKKLRNPLLRKLMAGRTTIAMAAKIGGCTPEDFFQALAPLGFEWQDAPAPAAVATATDLPSFLSQLEESQQVHLDVRDMLAGGEDPLKLIQQTVKDMQSGQVLLLLNTFEPTPLIALLGRQGFKSHVSHEGPELVKTYFYKEENQNPQPEAPLSEKTAAPADRWEELMRQYDGKLVEVDVRHLEMPQPMMTILGKLDKLPAGKALYVHHKRIPVFLLDELAQRDFLYSIKEVNPGAVFLLIYKEPQ